MGCNNYSFKHFKFVERRRKGLAPSEFKNFLEEKYNRESVESILDAIESGNWNEEFQKPFELGKGSDDSFLLEKQKTSNLMPLYKDPIYGGSIAMAKTIREFEEEIVERLIYDKKGRIGIDSSIVLPNGISIINYKLLDFKKQLLANLWDVTGKNKRGNYESSEELTKIVKETLKDFELLLIGQNEKAISAYSSYVKLKAFDLLIGHLDFIEIKQGYKDGRFIGSDMYVYKGPQMKRDASFGKEFAEISDYTGSVVKLLLNRCFRREIETQDKTIKEGGYITEVSFNRAMTRLFEWYMYGDGRHEDKDGYNKLITTSHDIDYTKLINTYLNKHKSGNTYQLTINSILRGVMNQIFDKSSGLTPYIRGCFDRHVIDTFSQVYLQYSVNPESRELENKETTDYFVELQSTNIQNIVKVQSEFWKIHLKNSNKENSVFSKVLKDHAIKINSQEKTISIHGDTYILTQRTVEGKKGGNVWDISLKNSREESNINDDMAIGLIRDILGIEITSDYRDIIGTINDSSRSLMSVFEKAIVLTLASASDGFNFIKYDKSNLLNTYYYRNDLKFAADYLSEVYGEDSINVIRNKEGNALPLYSLGSLSKKLKRVLHRMRNSSVAQHNPYVSYPNLLMREYVRSQVELANIIKASKELGLAELMSVQMLSDYWNNLNKQRVDDKVATKTMPITLSDKSTHTLYEVDASSYFIEGVPLSELLLDIGKFGLSPDRNSTKQLLKNDYSERESSKIKNLLIHILKQYNEVYKFGFDSENNDLKYLKRQIDKVNGILKTKTVNEVKSDFKNQNRFVEFLYCDVNHLGELSINPQILFEADVHVFKTESFDDIIRQNQIDFIEDMRSNRFKINRSLYKNVTTINGDWYDKISGLIEPFLIYDENKNLIKDHTQKIDWNKCTYELHPVLESYFYANMLLNIPLQEMMLGTTYTYKGFATSQDNKQRVINELNEISKIVDVSLNELTLNSSYNEILNRKQVLTPGIAKILSLPESNKKSLLSKFLDTSGTLNISNLLQLNAQNIPMYDRLDRRQFYQETMSLKLIDKIKRALIVGSTITSPILDRRYCSPRQIDVAIFKDFYGFAFNLSGESSNKEPHDGSGWTHPIFSRAINFGLFDAAVGSNKKTIAGELDPETLVFREIKWAEFELSNQYRKRSYDEAEMSAEIMFKKMSDKIIPYVELATLDISHFYGKAIHYSKYYQNIQLTHSDDIFFFNPKDGKYYKILSVTSSGNNCTRTIRQVNSHGIEFNNTTIEESIPMNTIYDLDQIFGGCFCKKLSKDGVLIDSDANSDIIYKITSEQNWFKYIISIGTNVSGFKTGVENINTITTSSLSKTNNTRSSIFSRNNNTPLKTISFDLSNYGVIMDADHHIDNEDNSVKEMGQVIAALIQEGASVETVNTIYKYIGELAYTSVADFIEAHRQFLNGDKEKLMIELGKAVIDAFDMRQQGNIALAYAFLDSLKQSINMPFSSHAISGVVLSAIGSKLTKLSLKTSYPGLGTVQVPSNGIMKYYNYGGRNYDFEGLVKRLKIEGISTKDIYEVGEFKRDVQINPETGEKFISITPSNKTLNEISRRTDIDFEDTLVIYDVESGTHEIVKISDVYTRDYYRTRFDYNGKLLYKWTVKSRDLLPQITRFQCNGENYTAWDLSSYRAMAYATSLLNSKAFSADDLEKMKSWLQNYAPTLKFEEASLKNFVKEQKKLFKETLYELSEIRDGQREFLSKDPSFANVTIQNIRTDAGQIILGKRFMKQFGLRMGDDLASIKSSSFFKNRLNQQYSFPEQSDVPKELYDAVLYTKDGDKILVILSDLDDTRLAGTTTYTGNVLSVQGDTVWYKNEEEIKLSKNINIRSKVINGKEHIVLAVSNTSDLEVLRNSSCASMVRLNYQQDNFKALSSYEYQIDWNSDEDVFTIDGLDVTVGQFKELNENEQLIKLRATELLRVENFINSLAQSRFTSFQKSLKAIGARIPAQSMQSFMSLEVVGFTDSEMNDIYVPYTLTWVAGSDYDIDKVYVMQYSISEDGTLYSYTNLKGYSADDLLKFPLPKGRYFDMSDDEGYIVTESDVNDILNRSVEPLLKILNQDKTILQFVGDISISKRKKVLRLLNRHENFKMSEKHKQGALKNFIVNQIINVVQDPKNQINVLTPVHTRKIKNASSNSELGEREKHLSLLTPSATMVMQDQTMLGKTSIASSATGEKVYFHILNHYSTEIMKLTQLLKDEKVDNSFKITKILSTISQLIIKSPIYKNSYSFIGNSSLKPIIRAIEGNGKLLNDVSHIPIDDSVEWTKIFINEDNQTFNLLSLLFYLHDNSNKTNCSEDMSEIITSSTDNAKNLDLRKIGAIPETLDIFTYLVSIGTDLTDVLNFTQLPAFKICVDFVKNSMFIPSVGWNSFDQVVKFVRNTDVLWGFNSFPLKREITNPYFWKDFLVDELNGTSIYKMYILPLLNTIVGENFEMSKPDQFHKFMKLFEINIPGIDLSQLFLKYMRQKLSEKQSNSQMNEETLSIIIDAIANGDELDMPSDNWDEIRNYIDGYVYFKEFFIPKNNEIKSVLNDITMESNESWRNYIIRYYTAYNNRIDNVLSKLEDEILPGVHEQQFLGHAFSINKGLATSDYNEYKWVAKFNKLVNEIIWNYAETKFVKNLKAFDLIEFINNTKTYEIGDSKVDYRTFHINQMEQMKHTSNILQVIVNAEHTWNRIKAVGVLRDITSTIGIFDFERKIVKKVLHQDVDTISKNHTYQISETEWTNVRNYARKVFIWNWFNRQNNLKFKLLPNQTGFLRSSDKTPITLNEGKDCVLNNQVDLANFKWFVETEFITWLKQQEKYKDNQFVQKIISGGVVDKDGTFISFLKFPFALQDVDETSTYNVMYSNILNDFNKIMFNEVQLDNFKEFGWTIGDVFFVYNLYVNNESSGSDSMLKLFEDNVLYGNQLKTAKSYYNYLSAIDKWGTFESRSVQFNEGDVIDRFNLEYNINDLIYAMRFSGQRRAKMYGAETLSPENVNVPRFGKAYPAQSRGYFLFNFPYLFKESHNKRMQLLSPVTIDVKDLRSNYSGNLENESTIRTITEHMANLFANGSNVPIRTIYKDEVPLLFEQDLASELSNHCGFIKDGMVYIIIDNATLDTPIHEMAHLVCAGMKFSISKSVRDTYYKLLKAVSRDNDLVELLTDFDANDYQGKYLSDLREEMLVRVLSAHLKNAFVNTWPSELVQANLTPNELNAAIVKTLHAILQVTDVPAEQAGRFTLEAILTIFNSKLFDLSGGWLSSGVVITSQRVSTIKSRLFKDKLLTLEGDC